MRLGNGDRVAFITLFLGLSIALAGCGGAVPSPAAPVRVTDAPSGIPGATTPAGLATPSMIFSGNTSDVPVQIANALGCTNVAYNAHLDNWVSAEVTCLFAGDNEVTIFSFANATAADKWFALGPMSADESGTVVRGDSWAVEPFNASQAGAIQHIIGGVIAQQR